MKKFAIDKVHSLLDSYRQKKGYTWVEVTARLNIGCKNPLFYKEMYSRLKKGEIKITIEQVKAIQRTFNIKLLA